MTAQQTPDRDQLAKWREQTAAVVASYGKEAWAEIHASEVLSMIDALNQAEADVKRGRAEALRDAASADWGNSDTLWRCQKVRMKLISLAHQIEEETPDEQ